MREHVVRLGKRVPVSVIVMTKNEEANIAKCLRALRAFDEVFVVDSGSGDRTCAIAADLGATVVPFTWNGRYPKKKQWCLDELPFRHDWVLYVDADEEVRPELTREIAEAVAGPPRHAGYFVGYDYVFLGRVLRHGHRVYKLVLLNRHKARFPERDDLDVANMWEVEGHYQPLVEGTTGVLRARMRHDDHDTLYHYFERHNRYSDWEGTLRARRALLDAHEPQPTGRRALKALFARLPAKGLVAFLHSFVGKAGFLDGRAGFHYAVARAVYYWQIGLKTREARAKR
ncbi:MAG TPA: glycosyltransferase family 2 protein [Methylomirabilota bacterium]|nr:glycosyltransferase family 2 protein [Methylomirabilota bacterium]